MRHAHHLPATLAGALALATTVFGGEPTSIQRVKGPLLFVAGHEFDISSCRNEGDRIVCGEKIICPRPSSYPPPGLVREPTARDTLCFEADLKSLQLQWDMERMGKSAEDILAARIEVLRSYPDCYSEVHMEGTTIVTTDALTGSTYRRLWGLFGESPRPGSPEETAWQEARDRRAREDDCRQLWSMIESVTQSGGFLIVGGPYFMGRPDAFPGGLDSLLVEIEQARSLAEGAPWPKARVLPPTIAQSFQSPMELPDSSTKD